MEKLTWESISLNFLDKCLEWLVTTREKNAACCSPYYKKLMEKILSQNNINSSEHQAAGMGRSQCINDLLYCNFLPPESLETQRQ